MNARAVTTDVLLGIVPIALLVALWQAIASFGYAPASLLPPPVWCSCASRSNFVTGTFQHEIGATLFRLFAGFSIAVIFGVQHRTSGGGQSGRQFRSTSDRAGAGAVAQGRAVSGTAVVARFRSRIEDYGWLRQMRCFRFCFSTYYGASMVGAEIDSGRRWRRAHLAVKSCSRWCCRLRVRRSLPAAALAL